MGENTRNSFKEELQEMQARSRQETRDRLERAIQISMNTIVLYEREKKMDELVDYEARCRLNENNSVRRKNIIARRAMGLSDNASIEELAIARARHSAHCNFDGNIKKELAIAKERAEAIFPSDSIHVLLNLHPSAIAKRKKAREDIADQKSLETKEQVKQWEHITRATNKCLFWLFNK